MEFVALLLRFAKAFFLAHHAVQGALADHKDQTAGREHETDALDDLERGDGRRMLKFAQHQLTRYDDPDQRDEHVEERDVGGRESDLRLTGFRHSDSPKLRWRDYSRRNDETGAEVSAAGGRLGGGSWFRR